MKILFFTKGDRSVASSRLRVWYVAERLKNIFGYDYDVFSGARYPLWRISTERFRILRDIIWKIRNPEVKILYVHKSLFPFDFVILLILLKRKYGKKMIYDLDDAEWLHSGFKTRMLARSADVVFCGSHAILDWARGLNSRLELIPSVVDYELYSPFIIHPASRNIYTLVWEGAPAHLKDGHIKFLKEITDELYRKTEIPFRLVLISSEVSGMKDLLQSTPYKVFFDDTADWANDPQATARTLKKYEPDIAFNPLDDTLWNKAKCALKSVEYMACGIPTLQSNVGENAFLTKDGENGYLFSSVAEAVKKTKALLENLELRGKISGNSLETIRRHYSYQAVIPRIAEVIKTLDVNLK